MLSIAAQQLSLTLCASVTLSHPLHGCALVSDLSPPRLNISVLLLTGTPFPKTFMQVAKKILSRLFRVFVHVYIHHFDRVSQMGAEAHVNTCYKHFYYFVTEFSLIDHKELEPLVSVCA